MANEKFTKQTEIEKIRTPFAQTISRETDKGLYYEIMYYDPADGEIHIGYGSYNPQYVFEWLDEFFVIDKSIETDFRKIVRCKDCYWNDRDGRCMNPKCGKSWYGCPVPDEHYCSYGEKRGVE